MTQPRQPSMSLTLIVFILACGLTHATELLIDIDHFADAQPVHRVRAGVFFIDTTAVTNERFVDAIGQVTVAEHTQKVEDFSRAPPENLIAGSVVFTPPDQTVLFDYQRWSYLLGAHWRDPEDPGSSIDGRMSHPIGTSPVRTPKPTRRGRRALSHRDRVADRFWRRLRVSEVAAALDRTLTDVRDREAAGPIDACNKWMLCGGS